MTTTKKQWRVTAYAPRAGQGSVMDYREVGPFSSLAAAEAAAVAFAGDPRAYATIEIKETK